jgi:hypothetical protein
MSKIHSYSTNEPTVPKNHKITKFKINGKLIYFVIKSGNKLTKDLTDELTEHYMKKEKQKKDAIEYQYWEARMIRSQRGVFG